MDTLLAGAQTKRLDETTSSTTNMLCTMQKPSVNIKSTKTPVYVTITYFIFKN